MAHNFIQIQLAKLLSLLFLLIILQYFPVSGALAQLPAWEHTNGPFGGTVKCLLQTNDGRLIAGTNGGGLFTSLDTAQSWNQIAQPDISNFKQLFLEDLMMTAEGTLFGASYSGVLRSIDQGVTWTLHFEGLNDRQITCLAADGSGNIFAGSINDGLFASADAGETWVSISSNLDATFVTGLFVTPDGNILLATTDGAYYSLNGGQDWQRVSNSLPDKSSYQYITDIYAVNNDFWIIGTLAGEFYSDNSGNDWNAFELTGNIYRWEEMQGSIIALGGGPVYSSENGVQWEVIGPSIKSTVIYDIESFGPDRIITGAVYYGIFELSGDGSQWDFKVDGLHASKVDVLAHTDDFIFAGTLGGVYRTSDGGSHWMFMESDDIGKQIKFLRTSPDGRLFIGTGRVLGISDDHAESWTTDYMSFNDEHPLDVCFGENDDIYMTTYSSIYNSEDGGSSWQKLNTEIPGNATLTLAYSSEGMLYAGTRYDGVYRSDDGGMNWEPMNTGLGSDSYFSVIRFEHDGIYLGGQFGIYRSEDNGQTWTDLENNFHYRVNNITSDANGNLFVSSLNGISFSTDRGETWMELENGLENTRVTSLINDKENMLYAGTNGGGVFKLNGMISSIRAEDAITQSFRNVRNYPNPFINMLNIEWEMPSYANIRVIIMNSTGDLISVLHEGFLPRGLNTLQWDGCDSFGISQPPGMYFLQIHAEGNSAYTKLIKGK